MKKTHVVLVIVVGILIAAVIGVFNATTTSVGFDEAFEKAGTEFKVSGTLDATQPIIYDPEVDHALTVFHMTDKFGKTQKVNLRKPRPQGIERSESIDLYGKVIDGEFYADEMLMKCPSKYNENNHIIETADAAKP